MQKTKLSARFVSLILTLSILLSLFSVFAFAEEAADGVSDSELSIAYNRAFSEGWDYTNGIVDALAKGNTARLAYEYRNSTYNYYLRLEKQNTKVSYLYIDTEGRLAETGKTFIEFDVTSGEDCAIGQAVRVSVSGDIKTLVEFRDDGMYVLGENVGSAVYAMKWESLAFEFDFDYVSAETRDTAYKVMAYYNGELISERVWEYGMFGGGISQVRFVFGDIREQNVGAWYGVDNVKVYSGVDEFTALDSNDNGLAVDKNLERDFVLAGTVADPDGYLRGDPNVDRLEDMGNAVVHYNRHFGEGWTLANGASVVDGGNNVDIRSEKNAKGEYNYFYRFRALGTAQGYMHMPIAQFPTDSPLYVELDIKSGVYSQLGGILQMRTQTGDAVYALGIEDGQLKAFDVPLGYIGTDWLHIILVFSNMTNDEGLYTCTVYYGENGKMECTYDIGVVAELRLGCEGGGGDEKYGDWYGVDNLQLYSGTKQFITIPDTEYGLCVDVTREKDFKLEDASVPETPVVPDHSGDVGTGDYVVNVNPNRVLKGEQNLVRVDLDDNSFVRYNRHYGEGWGFMVGGTAKNNNAIFQLQAEQEIDLSYNYYQYYEATTGSNAYWSFSTGTKAPTEGKIFIELDIRAVEGCDVGGVIQLQEKSGTQNNYLLAFEDGCLVTEAGGTKVLGKVTEDQWIHVAIEFDYDYASNNPDLVSSSNQYMIRMWVGDETYYEKLKSSGGQTFGLSGLRIGFEGAPAATYGQFWNMDNLKVYWGTDTFANIPSDNYGEAIDVNLEKDFPIQTTAVSLDTMIQESLFMKIGSEYGLVNNERTPNLTDEHGKAVGAPRLIDDQVWIPLDTILNFLSYPIYIHEDGMSFDISTGTEITYITLGRNTAVVGGTKIDLYAAPAMVTDKLGYEYLSVTLEDLGLLFPEFLVGLDDMNMITFSKYEEIASGTMTESLRIDIMKDFLFSYLEADEFYERAADYTDNFDHPYLIANQEKFDELSAVWHAGRLSLDDDPDNDVEYDEILYKYINAIVNSARSYYNRWSNTSLNIGDGGIYEGLVPSAYIYDSESKSSGLQHPYKSTAGYDPKGGRLNPPFDPLEPFAYAYQITKDIRFAQIAFDYCQELVDWDHWGPGHFLNAADTAASVAVCYDWLYDIWVELGYDVDKIADGIFYHGTLQGYLVSTGNPDPHGRAGGNGSNYPTMVNNWNPVCTAGIAAASFAIMNYTGYSTNTKLEGNNSAVERAKTYGGEMVRETAAAVIAMNFKSLVRNGLEIYAPDGSYEESVSYWAYGANNLFRYCMILESTLGDDLGLMDTWGVDRTCYSITHMVSSDFVCFAYNDGSVGGACSSGSFNYVAQSVGDDFIRLVRQMHINEGGLGISMMDSFFYKPVEMRDDLDMPLQYHHVGINGYTVRSSWERGAIFAGLLGGDNDDGHGHIDAGQWVYYSNGVRFIEDIGPDGYNTYNYFGNNHMYKTTVEGHSVICVTSDQVNLPAGQLRNSVSPVIRTYDNEHGSYVVVNTLPAFGNTLTVSERGMLFTNDRSTVIIQDEIIPNGAQSMYWLAHYFTSYESNGASPNIVNVEISNNGRTAWLTSKKMADGKSYVLRMQMVSPTPGISFVKMGAYDFLLDATMRPGDSEAMGKNPEGDRSHISKLAVYFENLMTVNFAVALEVVDRDNPIDIGYRWTPMDDWDPYADTRLATEGGDDKEDVTERTGASVSDLIGYTQRIAKLIEDGSHFEQISEFYAAITQMTYTVNRYGKDYFLSHSNEKFQTAIVDYENYYNIYHAYVSDIWKTSGAVDTISNLLAAYKPKAEVAE
ncbi:MAG: heparinase II/III family protein [Clostridia bacterium]|nr:heparinase II/III family protein [Clostridia bacterium]